MNDNSFTTGFALALQTLHNWSLTLYAMLPNIVAGIMVLGLFALIAFALRKTTLRYFRRRNRYDLGRIVSNCAFWLMMAVGVLVVLTIILPSLQPVDMLSSLGLGSLAIGFAFKDILQNWLAGLLILLRLPFRRGDQVRVGEVEGTVQRIEPRATLIRTYDGRDVVMPNTTIYTNPIIIQTSQEVRRVEIDFTVGYAYDIRRITAVIRDALSGIAEIRHDPPVQILCWELGATSLGIKVRWWIASERAQEIVSRARAIQAIKEAFDANDIDPTDPQLIYYRDGNQPYPRRHEDHDSQDVLKKMEPHGPPPNVPVSIGDPEKSSPKKDTKDETLLPENENP
jgi:small-conductance mechanosensitive channel